MNDSVQKYLAVSSLNSHLTAWSYDETVSRDEVEDWQIDNKTFPLNDPEGPSSFDNNTLPLNDPEGPSNFDNNTLPLNDSKGPSNFDNTLPPNDPEGPSNIDNNTLPLNDSKGPSNFDNNTLPLNDPEGPSNILLTTLDPDISSRPVFASKDLTGRLAGRY